MKTAQVWLEVDQPDEALPGRSLFLLAGHDEVMRWMDTSPDDAITIVRDRTLNLLAAIGVILDTANREDPNG